ncbi:ABC transporter ATP-binding protein [Paenibacillus turpanensis]|uniref:ABC transporter ATP-binding protein n=1 Tax=Paenibacillus turpanensis TaxID=2689078 RepID=UPI00140A75EF|nr:ABC transporter ATP-binding protein [Paenibacillus turpanensis]
MGEKRVAPNDDKQIILAVSDVKKAIGGRMIIKGISFDVREGEIFGFLGPNGSGKTTTIRMLVDLIKPTAGAITLCGKDVHKQHDEALQHVGCIVENPELYPFLTGWENLEHFAGMLPGVGEQRIREVAEIVGLDQRIHDKVKTYSLGMRQRLGIAQALLGNPKLLILDEPTNGLDPQGIKELRTFIRKLADQGMGVFVSSHLLSEIQLMCDRVAIILNGEVIAVGEVDELLKERTKQVSWRLEPVETGRSVIASFEGVTMHQLELSEQENAGNPASLGTDNVESFTAFGQHMPESLGGGGAPGTVTVWMEKLDDIPLINEQLVAKGVRIYAVEPKQPALEDLFLTLTEGNRID